MARARRFRFHPRRLLNSSPARRIIPASCPTAHRFRRLQFLFRRHQPQLLNSRRRPFPRKNSSRHRRLIRFPSHHPSHHSDAQRPPQRQSTESFFPDCETTPESSPHRRPAYAPSIARPRALRNNQNPQPRTGFHSRGSSRSNLSPKIHSAFRPALWISCRFP